MMRTKERDGEGFDNVEERDFCCTRIKCIELEYEAYRCYSLSLSLSLHICVFVDISFLRRRSGGDVEKGITSLSLSHSDED